MNVHPDSDGELIAGGFALFRRDEHSGASMLEDGFVINLDNEGWTNFRNTLASKQNVLIPGAGGNMPFQVVWNLSRNPEINSGLGQSSGDGEGVEAQESGLMGKIKNLFKR